MTSHADSITSTPGDHWVATLGVNTDELVETGVLPAKAPGYPHPAYSELCDWLIERLVEDLNHGVLAPVSVVEDARTGETLSVRIKFHWDLAQGWPEVATSDSWWELLELGPFDEIYR